MALLYANRTDTNPADSITSMYANAFDIPTVPVEDINTNQHVAEPVYAEITASTGLGYDNNPVQTVPAIPIRLDSQRRYYMEVEQNDHSDTNNARNDKNGYGYAIARAATKGNVTYSKPHKRSQYMDVHPPNRKPISREAMPPQLPSDGVLASDALTSQTLSPVSFRSPSPSRPHYMEVAPPSRNAVYDTHNMYVFNADGIDCSVDEGYTSLLSSAQTSMVEEEEDENIYDLPYCPVESLTSIPCLDGDEAATFFNSLSLLTLTSDTERLIG